MKRNNSNEKSSHAVFSSIVLPLLVLVTVVVATAVLSEWLR